MIQLEKGVTKKIGLVIRKEWTDAIMRIYNTTGFTQDVNINDISQYPVRANVYSLNLDIEVGNYTFEIIKDEVSIYKSILRIFDNETEVNNNYKDSIYD